MKKESFGLGDVERVEPTLFDGPLYNASGLDIKKKPELPNTTPEQRQRRDEYEYLLRLYMADPRNKIAVDAFLQSDTPTSTDGLSA